MPMGQKPQQTNFLWIPSCPGSALLAVRNIPQAFHCSAHEVSRLKSEVSGQTYHPRFQDPTGTRSMRFNWASSRGYVEEIMSPLGCTENVTPACLPRMLATRESFGYHDLIAWYANRTGFWRFGWQRCHRCGSATQWHAH